MSTNRWVLAAVLVAAPASGMAQQAQRVPTIDDLLGIRTVGAPQLSPDGRRVAYIATEPDFKQNAFVSQVWVVNSDGTSRLQITRGEKSSQAPAWSPDGQWLAFTSGRAGDKTQLFVIRPDGGEAVQLTKGDVNVGAFGWSHDGKTIAFTGAEPTLKPMKDRKETYGDFEVIHHEYAFVHLYTVDVIAALGAPVTPVQRTHGSSFSVSGFDWSPDDRRIAFAATKNPDLIQGTTSDIYVLTLTGDAVAPLVTGPAPEGDPLWSPDGATIAFTSPMDAKPYYAVNTKIGIVSANGGTPRIIAQSFDEQPDLIVWTTKGLWFGGRHGMASHLFIADPAAGSFRQLSAPDTLIGLGWSLSADGTRAAFITGSPTAPYDIAVADLAAFTPNILTDVAQQAAAFTLATRERFSWKSKDGATIEGVLIKPKDWTPTKTYPLLCVIHGGPTGTDVPVLLSPDIRYYPVDLWAARGAMVLKVNYRGSAGYGEKFRTLNIRNLGVGDAWDVLSGVDALIKRGWVDSTRVGSMGWSQGGYISAFLTTSTTRFKAISVGAGISDWATYYYNTDITPFTINYLGADPVADPEIYRKTSPITYVKGAKTPTLIQHGDLDRRVPIANAYQLRQALEDRGVPVEMVVYKGFGHPITKPREQRAVMRHNLEWFDHFIFGDPMPDLSAPPIPDTPAPDAARAAVPRGVWSSAR
jgi:dipeptidyl aminopeptidase/acylaminoacyl peptidase